MNQPELLEHAGIITNTTTLFQRVVDSLRERFVVVDKKFNIVIINDSALPNHFLKEQVLGRKIFDVYPNLAEQGFKHFISTVFDTGEPYVELYARHTTIDSFTGYHHRKVIPIKNGTHVDFVIVIVENVHEEKVAREYAMHIESTYQKLIETLQLVSFELDAAGHFVHVSSAVMPVLGYSVDDLIGKTFTHHVHTEDVRQMWNIYWQIVNQGREFGVCENRFLTKKGLFIHMRWSIHPLFGPDGTIIGCRGVGEDISETVARTESCKQRLTVFEQTFQVAPQPLLVVKNGKTLMYNRAALRLLFGRSVHTPEQTFVELFVPNDRAMIEAFFKRLRVRGRDSVQVHVARHLKNGGEKNSEILCTLTAIQIHGSVVVAIDVVAA